MRSIGEIVNFFYLPRMQAFGQIVDVFAIAWRSDLLRKDCRISGKIEGLVREYARRLMIAVILTGDVIGQPRGDHGGARQPH